MTEALIFTFFCVFLRTSAMLMSSPFFGAQSTPLPVRILLTMAFAGAITGVIHMPDRPIPADLYGVIGTVFGEIIVGLLIGGATQFALQSAQIAGAMLDIQVGLGSSQVLNPATGIPSTVLSQFKSMLALVVYLGVNGHHVLLQQLIRSFQYAPPTAESLPLLKDGIVRMTGQVCMMGLQIAAPVIAVSLIVDAGLAVISRAVPQMPVQLVGAPLKIGIGLVILALTLPVMTVTLSGAIQSATENVMRLVQLK